MSTQNQPARYWTYSNYIVATSRLLRECYAREVDLVQALSSSQAVTKLHASPGADRNRVAELLRSAWYTEVLITQLRNQPALLPYSSPWTMVQVYYAIYQHARAYFAIAARSIAPTHSATMSVLASDLRACKDRFPSPWRCMCADDPRKLTISLMNDANAPPIALSNPTSSPYTNPPWQHFGLFLKTTRRRQFQERLAEWRMRNTGRRASGSVSAGLLSTLRPTTIFDAIYRIRARSNYMDLDAFIFGSRRVSDAKLLHDSLLEIAQYSMCVFEYLIAKSAGRSWFDGTVTAFLSSPLGSPGAQSIGARWSIMSNYV